MQITVLGKSPAWQDPGGTCSGYLVQEGGTRLLLDCGSGVFARLREVVDETAVDAVVLSHLHADHFLDLIPYAYALTYAPRDVPASRPALHAPPGARAVFRRVTGAWGSDDLIEDAFTVHEYDPADILTVGALRVRFHPVPHYVPAWAVEISARDGGTRFTFGADCGPSDGLVQFAQGSDLLMLEATLAQPETDGARGHLTAGEAGELGRRAGCRRLVVTHFPAALGEQWVRSQAEATFGASVELAQQDARFTL